MSLMPTRFRHCLLASTLLAPAALHAAEAAAPPPPDEITVTASRLDKARDSILPSLGASNTVIDRVAIETQPQGADRGLQQVLLQIPGVAQDSYGEIHVRNEHGNVQYRINGVIIPESISGFGQTIDTRLAESVSLLTGTLPAQYGYRTSAVINVVSQSGSFDNGGDVGLYGGSHGTIQPSATIKGSSGGLNYFVSGSYLQNDLGVENPTPGVNALHDRTEQYRGFVYLSDILSDTSRISVFGGSAVGRFQIPNNPGQPPAFPNAGPPPPFVSGLLDQNQREQTHYGVLAYQYSGDALNLQVAPFIRYSQTRFSPDPRGGDIVFNGFSDASKLSSLAFGVQADASYKLSDHHTLRGGVFFQNERTRSSVLSQVLALPPGDAVPAGPPIPILVTGGKTGQLYGVYVQDEWTLSPELTINAGVRFDAVNAYTSEQQLSPRLNLVYQPGAATTIHAGYARDFTPPPQELIGATTVARFDGTTKASETKTADPVKAEREHYFDAGVLQTLGRFSIGLDGYYKIKRNLLDEGQFGESLVLSPFNYAKGWAWGVELATTYKHGPVSLYANLARGQEKAQNIVSSQFFFAPDELAYIAAHPIYTDHSQFWTGSAGGSVTFHDGLGTLVPSADLIYGDGLRAGDPGGLVPNGGKLPSYLQVNFGIAQNFDGPGFMKGVSLRFDITNIADASYVIRDGSGVGVGAPQFGPRRAFFGGIRKTF